MKTIKEAEQRARHAQAWFASADITTFTAYQQRYLKWAMHDVAHVMRSLLLMVAGASDAHARDVVVNFHERGAG